MTRCPIDDYYDEAGWWLDTAGEFDARLPDYNGFCFGDLWVTRCGWAEGDPEVGRDIAQEHCVRCHDVSPAGEFKTYPPSFASIAVYRDVDQIRSRIAFPQLHSAMPQMIYLLDTDDVADLVAYITSLEAEPEWQDAVDALRAGPLHLSDSSNRPEIAGRHGKNSVTVLRPEPVRIDVPVNPFRPGNQGGRGRRAARSAGRGRASPRLIEATRWQAHSVGSFLSGTPGRKHRLNVTSAAHDGVHRYRIGLSAVGDEFQQVSSRRHPPQRTRSAFSPISTCPSAASAGGRSTQRL